MGHINLGKWAAVQHLFLPSRGVPSIAGISGGRTSAMMAALLSIDTILCFQNTGREHPATYDFLHELEKGLGREIVWLEIRPPKKKGAPPREFEFAIVDYKTADRSGGPFETFLEGLADYRATKGLNPISPWARQRICTAYMKSRMMAQYAIFLGMEVYDTFVGLRADEPDRVKRIRERDTQARVYRCPLAVAKIGKPEVMEFWRSQVFNLQLEDHQGNCTACFLKDQSDLARVLGEEATDAEWWFNIEEKYEDFGGRNFPGYRKLAGELPARLQIETALRAGENPKNDGSIEPRRFKFVVRQERGRLAGTNPGFSCACEQSLGLSETDTDHLVG